MESHASSDALNNVSVIWDMVLEITKKRISEISFLTWIKSMELISIDSSSSKIVLCVPSLFNKGIVECRYYHLLKEALFEITSQEYSIDMIVGTDKETIFQRNISNDSHFGLAVHKAPDLNPAFLFDNFVVGESNRIGFMAAKEFATKSASLFNPLYIYGGVGTGKTHLVQAAANCIVEDDESVRVKYITVEKFINELINHIREEKDADFIGIYEYLDILIIDDLHFIEGKERSQEELCKVLNKLIKRGKRIILADRKSPENITVLNERFSSLFEMGAVAELKEPDAETKRKILMVYGEQQGASVPNEVIDLIASGHYTGVRELKGALNRICAIAQLSGQDINMGLVRQYLVT